MFCFLLYTLFAQGCSSTSGEQPKEPANTGFHFKDKLSDYGFFAGDLKQLKPQAALFHYELATPLFTDYAAKTGLYCCQRARPQNTVALVCQNSPTQRSSSRTLLTSTSSMKR